MSSLELKKYLVFLFLTAILTISGSVFSANQTIILTDDCSADVVEAKEDGVPIMLVFGTDDCGYCKRMKQEVLVPELESHHFDHRVLVRELDIKSGGKITDFDGNRVRTGQFVNRYEIFATPTVIIVDYQGKPISAPIVGYNDATSYKQLLNQAIDDATMGLAISKKQNLAKTVF
ncbi:MAG: hypothetical protein C0631_02375 [Sedimenticola sp.]|jgi:thioredoxin-related protein|nr:MAG: hypothetical protein C0631_02375 [Sedimenticola sp.]